MKMNSFYKTAKLMTEDQASNVYDRVMSLKDHWRLRLPGEMPFYLMGIGTLPDKMNGDQTYLNEYKNSNKLLLENFKDVYDMVLDFFNKEIGPSKYVDDLALPLFFIYSNEIHTEKEPIDIPQMIIDSRIHHDDEHMDQEDYFGHEDLDHIAYTLSIKLPKNGSGLFVYGDIKIDSSCDKSDNIYQRLLKTAYGESEHNKDVIAFNKFDEPQFIKYETGMMVYHVGKIFHQIVVGIDLDSNDQRITFQGKGVKKDGVWVLYY